MTFLEAVELSKVGDILKTKTYLNVATYTTKEINSQGLESIKHYDNFGEKSGITCRTLLANDWIILRPAKPSKHIMWQGKNYEQIEN